MQYSMILSELRAEREKLDRAITAIEGIDGVRPARGRPRGAEITAGARRRGPRRMSAAARKRISERMKERWAERKKV